MLQRFQVKFVSIFISIYFYKLFKSEVLSTSQERNICICSWLNAIFRALPQNKELWEMFHSCYKASNTVLGVWVLQLLTSNYFPDFLYSQHSTVLSGQPRSAYLGLMTLKGLAQPSQNPIRCFGSTWLLLSLELSNSASTLCGSLPRWILRF